MQHSLATHGFAAQVTPAGLALRELVSLEQSKSSGAPSASVSPQVRGATVQHSVSVHVAVPHVMSPGVGEMALAWSEQS